MEHAPQQQFENGGISELLRITDYKLQKAVIMAWGRRQGMETEGHEARNLISKAWVGDENVGMATKYGDFVKRNPEHPPVDPANEEELLDLLKEIESALEMVN